MSTYIIGDIQGCYQELLQLLDLINFDQSKDCLWFVGDLVNRGPDSLSVLRFVKNLKDPIVVLGNHDLHLLAIFYAKSPLKIKNNLDEVITAPDGSELVDWLRMQPLLHHDADLGFTLTHAGIYPEWNLTEAMDYAKEVENILRSNKFKDFLIKMYGNKPDIWDNKLCGNDRLRFIINCFTRMRFCDLAGHLEFDHTGSIDAAPKGFLPWFKVPSRKTKNVKIVFGHWAALVGITDTVNVYALDTGCVWGRYLTAMRLEDEKKFSVVCAVKTR